jgi:hypothetical protein
LFWVARAIFQLSGDCHHYRWQGCKFRPMLSAYGFQQWGFFYVSHLLRHGTSVFKVIHVSERSAILPSECRALGEGAITTYFKRLRFEAAGLSGARTHDLHLLSKSTTNLDKVMKFFYRSLVTILVVFFLCSTIFSWVQILAGFIENFSHVN